MKPISRLDFETRSPVDLKTHGAYVYFEHPDAKVLIASYKYEGEKKMRRWRLGEPCPPDLEEHIRAGGVVRAFNAAFETLCFEWLAKNCGWPMPDYKQFVCTQSFARAMALPASLDNLGTALQLDVLKDKEGARLMRKFSIPNKKGPMFVEPEEDPEEFEKYHLYCDRDVETEEAADVKLVPLSDAEQAVWHLSEKINRRGLRIDVQSAHAAIRLADKAQKMINREVAELTGGAVQRVTEVAKLIAWAGSQGVILDSAAKGDISDALNLTDLPAVVRKVLELRLEGAKSSVTKIKGFVNRMNKDGRVRGCYTYHGANTGRWVSTGVNFANLPRPRGVFEDAHIEPETLFKAIRKEDPQLLIDLFGDELGRPMHLLSDAIRGLIWAAPGHRFIQADYSGIEGAVAAFLADETWKLKGMFEILADPKNNPDMYRQTAARIMNMTTDIITKKHFYRQAIGKTSELALGFGGSVSAFVSMANLYRVDLDSIYEPVWANASDEDKEYAEKRYRFNLARKQGGATEISKQAWMACQIIVKGWRASNPAIAQAWRDVEEAARSAIENPGTVFSAAKCKLIVKMGYMWMQLPSGRCLCFPSPKLSSQVWVQIKVEDGSFADAEVMEREIAEKLEAQGKAKIQGGTSPGISFLGVDSQTKKFVRKRTYGGDLFQSCLSGETEVLTPYGWKLITDISKSDLLWDGQEWVSHDGLIFQGVKGTIDFAGLRLTPDHKIWTQDGWKTAEETRIAEATAASSGDKLTGAALRAFAGGRVGRIGREEDLLVGDLRLRNEADLRGLGSAEENDGKLRMPVGREGGFTASYARDVLPPAVRRMGQHDGAVLPTGERILAKLRRARYFCLRKVAHTGQLLSGCTGDLPTGAVIGEDGQRKRLQPRKLSVGHAEGAGEEHPLQPDNRHAGRSHAGRGSLRVVGHRSDDAFVPDRGWVAGVGIVSGAGLPKPALTEPVYDILNAGPRHRFTVRTDAGPVIVSNCVQASARDILVNGMLKAEEAGYPIVLHTYDEMAAEVPNDFGSVKEFERIICQLPDWADGLPLGAEGYAAKRYKK